MRWSDLQVTIGADGKPLPRESRALKQDGERLQSPRKRKSEGEASGMEEGLDERGGAAAATSYLKAAKKADWPAVLKRVHGVGQCALCEAASDKVAGARCEEHSPPPGAPPGAAVWWQQPQADLGATVRHAEACEREQDNLRREDSGWRREWRRVRTEQLELQDEAHGAAEDRVRPGGPESVEWVTELFTHQIGLLVREANFHHEHAVGYTLLACGGVGALARAARDATGTAKADYPAARRLLATGLCGRVATPPPVAPPVFANLGGSVGLVRSDPAWGALTPDAAIGLSFTTSALVRRMAPAH